MWFDSWSDIIRIINVGTASYFAVIVIIRMAGKRTLSQLNAFDFIVTIALGSTLSTTLLNSTVSWTEGAITLLLLALLQLIIGWVSSHVLRSHTVIRSRPVLLLHEGVLQHDTIKNQRISEEDIRQIVRSSGSGSLFEIAAVVLESNGNFSVVPRSKLGDGSALDGVSGR